MLKFLPSCLSKSICGVVPRGPGRPRNSASREQFLDAAVLLFGEQGVSGTTMAEIARRVGATGPMVHYYFASREQLLDAVVTERLMPFVDHVWGAVTPETLADPRTLVLELAHRMLEGAKERPWLPTLWMSDIGSVAGELRERVFVHLPNEKILAFGTAIADAQARGEINAGLAAPLVFPTLIGMTILPLATIGYCSRVQECPDGMVDALDAHVRALLDAGLKV